MHSWIHILKGGTERERERTETGGETANKINIFMEIYIWIFRRFIIELVYLLVCLMPDTHCSLLIAYEKHT